MPEMKKKKTQPREIWGTFQNHRTNKLLNLITVAHWQMVLKADRFGFKSWHCLNVSKWLKFPEYQFSQPQKKDDKTMSGVVGELNRYHIQSGTQCAQNKWLFFLLWELSVSVMGLFFIFFYFSFLRSHFTCLLPKMWSAGQYISPLPWNL